MTLREFITETGLTMRSQRLIALPSASAMTVAHPRFLKGASFYLCVISSTKSNGTLVVDYTMGAARTGPPKLETVLDSLASEADVIGQTFTQWCGSFGYAADSLKAKRIYDQCVFQTDLLIDLIGESAMQTLRSEVERL